MSLKIYNPIQQGLELQLEILKRTENVCDDDCLICIMCYQEEAECQCTSNEQVLWPVTHAVRMLESVVQGMERN